MLASLLEFIPRPVISDTGLPQQLRILEMVRSRCSFLPPVLDARDVLEDPQGMLQHCCKMLGVEFRPEMLSWPPGRRDTDGIWAKHWYDKV